MFWEGSPKSLIDGFHVREALPATANFASEGNERFDYLTHASEGGRRNRSTIPSTAIYGVDTPLIRNVPSRQYIVNAAKPSVSKPRTATFEKALHAVRTQR